jgi:hypothetical protein
MLKVHGMQLSRSTQPCSSQPPPAATEHKQGLLARCWLVLVSCGVGRNAVQRTSGGGVSCSWHAAWVLHEQRGGTHRIIYLIGAGYWFALGYLRGVPIYIHVLRGCEPARGPHGVLRNSAGTQLAFALCVALVCLLCMGAAFDYRLFRASAAATASMQGRVCWRVVGISTAAGRALYMPGQSNDACCQACCSFAADTVFIAAAAVAATGTAACSDAYVCLRYAYGSFVGDQVLFHCNPTASLAKGISHSFAWLVVFCHGIDCGHAHAR